MIFASAIEARGQGPLALRALAGALGPDAGFPPFRPPARFFVGRLTVLELTGPVAIGGVWTVDQVEVHAWPR